MEVLVVGGGVMGMSCALRMARRGARVRVFEGRGVGGGASGAAIGALWPGAPLSEEPLQRMHRESLWEFEGFLRGVEEESGVEVPFRRRGRVEILETERAVERGALEAEAACRQWAGFEKREEGAVMEVISREEVMRMLPGFGGEVCGGMLCRVTAQVDVRKLMEGLEGACLARGVEVCVGREVEGVFSGGVVVDGEKIFGEVVLVTAGAWTRRLVGGCRIRPVKGQAIALERPAGFSLERIVKHGATYVVPWEAEILVGATTEAEAGFDEEVTVEAREELWKRAVRMFPELTGRLLRHWAGLRPDGRKHLPMMGEVGEGSGVFVCAGHYKLGTGIAPRVSELMGQLIVEGGSVEELTPFAP